MAISTTATTIEDLHSDIISCVLRHVDGPTLAAANCSTSLLRFLSSDPALWRHICLSSWPSLGHPLLLSLLSATNNHRAFFSQSYPFPAAADETSTSPLDLDSLPARLVSAVDLYHNGTPVFSRVIDIDTSSTWFLTSPFRLDALDRKDPDAPPPPAATLADEPAVSPEDLTLSWAVIDPETRRAVNVSSRRPVAVDRHWYTGETLVRFAVMLRGCAVSAVVTCGEEMGQVREVRLTVEDMDGVSVSGRESLGLLKAAMEGQRRGAKWEKEVKESYEEYLKRKRERREKRARREGMLDLCCTGFGALMFFSFLMLLAFR